MLDVVLLVGIAVEVNLFALLYGSLARWWQTAAGIGLLMSKVSLAVFVDLALAVLVFGPDYPGRSVARHLGYLFIFLSQGVLLTMLVLYLTGRLREPSARKA